MFPQINLFFIFSVMVLYSQVALADKVLEEKLFEAQQKFDMRAVKKYATPQCVETVMALVPEIIKSNKDAQHTFAIMDKLEGGGCKGLVEYFRRIVLGT